MPSCRRAAARRGGGGRVGPPLREKRGERGPWLVDRQRDEALREKKNLQIFERAERVHLGKNLCWSVQHSVEGTARSGDITIGDDCVIGYGVKLLAGSHEYGPDGVQHAAKDNGHDIVVGRGAWLGSYCIIVGPVTIGEGAIIGAGSVVTHDVPAWQVWAGNPARFIKSLR